jgi:hypothetical protein
MNAVEDRLKTALGGQCLPTQLSPAEDGSVSCIILEARNSHGQCSCDATKARQSIEPGSPGAQSVAQAMLDPLATNANWDCFCEIPQATGEELVGCHNDASDYPAINGNAIDGWCYIDAVLPTPVGNPLIVKACPDNEKRLLRFVGEGNPRNNATVFISCQTEASNCNL